MLSYHNNLCRWVLQLDIESKVDLLCCSSCNKLYFMSLRKILYAMTMCMCVVSNHGLVIYFSPRLLNETGDYMGSAF